ncbi:ADP-ribosylglycohydrolase family protein [Phenylobacterium sp.]|uniref:ADP-ribosylglycohydrolase family protein n=1 Tax=Phenylobacterium sp. TaxID=1871053 RepID=UPI0025EB5B02|nr:ADP-ribosylglycohydrolase family protein [Phenylobacterium sp.]MBX3484987.1 ADP-ribosylglycohydrolase family protein [Phenylobacterium sp.]
MPLACAANAFRIDVIPHGRAAIGVSPCPGADDLGAVAAFRPDAIVTLLSAHEQRLTGHADLPEILSPLAHQWHQVPMRTSAAPDARFERLWSYAGHRLRATLRRGGRVLLHCDESGARARRAAARLLAELGAPSGEVAARTHAQPAPALRPLAEHHMAGRILGGLVGGAVGDAMGYPVEFRSRSRIRAAGGLSAPARLVVSDDTQMTLFTADGLLSGLALAGPPSRDRILARIRHAYLAWFRTQREDWTSAAAGLSQHRELWAVRAPGSTCLTALGAGARGTLGLPANDSKGSGAVMRIAPLGLVPAIDADTAFHLAHEVAALTHGHACGRLPAAALAGLLRDLLDETPMTAALDRMEARLGKAADSADVLALVRDARRLAACEDIPPEDAVAVLGEGWTGEEALAIGLYAALRADGFEDAVRLAAEHDGDSDTTAAIAGQIWGVLYGVDVIPHAWVQRLDVLEALGDVAGRLLAHAARDATHAPQRVLAPV